MLVLGASLAANRMPRVWFEGEREINACLGGWRGRMSTKQEVKKKKIWEEEQTRQAANKEATSK